MSNPTTETVSPERLAEILAGLPHFDPYPDELLSIVCELQRLRSPGGASALHAAASDQQQILSKLIDAGEIEITATDIGAEALCTRLNALKHALSNHGD